MTSQIDALKLALEALEHMLEDAKQERLTVEYWNECVDAITAIKQALAAPYVASQLVQEPVGEVKNLFTQAAWEKLDVRGSTKVYLGTIPASQPALGDIRALKHRIHELEGDVLGYKQMLDLAEEKLKSAPVQEPVAWIWTYANGEQEVVFVRPRHVDASHVDAPSTITSLYTTPPAAQRQWVGLTPEEIYDCDEANACRSALAYAIEAKLKEKNT